MSVVVLTGNSDSSTADTDTEDDEDILNASARSNDTSSHEGTPAIAALNNQPAAACAAAAWILRGGEDVEHTPVLLTVQTQISRGEMDICVVQLQGKVALLQQRMNDMERTNQRMKRALNEASRRSVVTDPATDPVGRDKAGFQRGSDRCHQSYHEEVFTLELKAQRCPCCKGCMGSQRMCSRTCEAFPQVLSRHCFYSIQYFERDGSCWRNSVL